MKDLNNKQIDQDNVEFSGGVTVEDIENLKDGEKLVLDSFTIQRECEEREIGGKKVRIYFVDEYNVTDAFGYQGESDSAEEIADAINSMMEGR